MTAVLGVDSSTQSTKALLVDAADGTVLERSAAPHPPGTEVDPHAWLDAFDMATHRLASRASAVGVGGQQHGMVARDEAGVPVRDALLWNDTGRRRPRPTSSPSSAGPRPVRRRSGRSWSPRSP